MSLVKLCELVSDSGKDYDKSKHSNVQGEFMQALVWLIYAVFPAVPSFRFLFSLSKSKPSLLMAESELAQK